MENELLRHTDLGNVDVLKKRIADGADVNLPSTFAGESRFPLDLAVEEGCIVSCRLLLEAGADPNRLSGSKWAPGDQKFVPLWHVAAGLLLRNFDEATAGELISLLLEFGADPNGHQPATDYAAPLVAIAKQGRTLLVRLLLAAGANPNVTGLRGKAAAATPCLEAICKDGKQDICILLLQYGAADDCIARDGLTPFQTVVRAGMDKVVSYYFAERGEDPAQRTHNGKTLLQIAKEASTREIIRSFKVVAGISEPMAVSAGDDIVPGKREPAVPPL
jgi:ankyrin repeat protein